MVITIIEFSEARIYRQAPVTASLYPRVLLDVLGDLKTRCFICFEFISPSNSNLASSLSLTLNILGLWGDEKR